MRPKVILSVLVGLALLLSFGVGVKDAKADALLFPWITKSDSVSTIISVVNTSGVPVPGTYYFNSVRLQLHYQYVYKKTTANLQTETCNEINFYRQTSKDDLVVFDAAGRFNSGRPLYNDGGPYASQRFDMGVGVTGPRRAYLIVDNNTNTVTNTDGTLYGEALVVEINSGAAWGYIAYNSTTGEASQPNSPVDFDDGSEVLGAVLANSSGVANDDSYPDERTAMVMLNPGSINTRLFVTPIEQGWSGSYSGNPCGGNDCSDDPGSYGDGNQRKTNINAAVGLYTMDQGGYLNGGIYDNDENPWSFTGPKQIICTSADNISAYVDPAVYDTWVQEGWAAWSYVFVTAGTIDQSPLNDIPDNPENAVCIGKLEYTEGSFNVDGSTVAGAINAFKWLRNGYEGGAGEYGNNNVHNEPYIDSDFTTGP